MGLSSMVLTYKGRRVDSLSREELIEACHRFHDMLERERQWNRTIIEIDDAFEQARKALRTLGLSDG